MRFPDELSGYSPALPTPFDDDGRLDVGALERLCGRQIRAGATAMVVCGTTGEAPTLTGEEYREIVLTSARMAHGRVPTIAGTGTNSTSHAIELARDAEAAGADALLCVVPYYNRPTQDGLYAHFRAIAESTGLPIILYDVPSRTACHLADSTIARLAELRQFIGLKDATGDMRRPLALRSLLGREFMLLSGDDASALAFIAQGGDGCISVVSNVAPDLCRSMYLAFRWGEPKRAQALARRIWPLTDSLFRETSPIPVKYALSSLGLMTPRVRLPLVELSEGGKREVTAAVALLSSDRDTAFVNDAATDESWRALAAC
jgi:4-hydroxy-tetrahydrodipicolinate synthase